MRRGRGTEKVRKTSRRAGQKTAENVRKMMANVRETMVIKLIFEIDMLSVQKLPE